MTPSNDNDITNIPLEPTKSNIRSYLLGAGLAALLVGLGYVVYSHVQLQQQMQTLMLETATLKTQQSNTGLAIQTFQTNLSNDAATFDKQLQGLDKSLQSALQQRWYQTNDWLLLKARYYIELATINAHWSNDTPTTAALLQQADQLLAAQHDQRLYPVRQALASEITQLNSVAPLDKAGLLSALNALQNTLEQLPLKNNAMLKKTNTTADSSPPLTGWRAQLQQTMQQLGKLIVIHHHDNAIQPLMTPAYEAMLLESIRFNLQMAAWAVLQNNQAVYQLSLSQASQQVNLRFDINAANTQALLKQIAQLQQQQITQQKIVPDRSLPLLNDYIAVKSAGSVGESS